MRMVYRLLILPMLLGLYGCHQSPYELGFTKEEWQKMPHQKRSFILKKSYRKHTVFTGVTKQPMFNKILVTLSDGTAILWPQKSRGPYDPVQIPLQSGQCKKIRLSHQNAYATLNLCYKEGVLLLDPSSWNPEKKPGTRYLYQTPLWHSGLTYKSIRSQGRVCLQNATINVVGYR